MQQHWLEQWYLLWQDAQARLQKQQEAKLLLMQQAAHWLWLTNAEFPPYEYYEGENVVGIDADIAAAVADKLGMELKIEDMAFD